eukprot:2688990-Rhodomonas_salina.1
MPCKRNVSPGIGKYRPGALANGEGAEPKRGHLASLLLPKCLIDRSRLIIGVVDNLILAKRNEAVGGALDMAKELAVVLVHLIGSCARSITTCKHL